MGRGPKDIHAYLLGDFLVVRLQGVLTAAEQHLAKSLSVETLRKSDNDHARPIHRWQSPLERQAHYPF
jgi:uncharacterized protein YbcI